MKSVFILIFILVPVYLGDKGCGQRSAQRPFKVVNRGEDSTANIYEVAIPNNALN